MTEDVTSNHYERWSNDELVSRFLGKSVSEYFESEVYFLKQIIENVDSVLDIGCASGKYIELIEQYGKPMRYTGVDIVKKNIDNATINYPEYQFILGNALDVDLGTGYDLVNAIGVFQHEPCYMTLLSRMISASVKYVLFDVKFANIKSHLIDIDLAYVGSSARNYFIMLNFDSFIEELLSLYGIQSVEVYGYPTEINMNTKIPSGVEGVISAAVLATVNFEVARSIDVVNNLSDKAKHLLGIAY